VAGYAAVALGRAALDRPGVRSGERCGLTEARVGIILALPAFLLFRILFAGLVVLRMR
jgi:hypothetical protein